MTIYLDDILIISESIENYYNHIKKVLGKCEKYNVAINLENFQFFWWKVSFLGYVISTDGVDMDTDNRLYKL